MDLAKLAGTTGAYVASYLDTGLRTLTEPGHHFRPVAGDYPLSSASVGYALVSIALGSSFQLAIPARAEADDPDRMVVFAITLTLWLLASVAAHGCARLLGGAARLSTSVAISLQLLSTLYVACSLAALFYAGIAFGLREYGYYHVPFGGWPAAVYFPIHLLAVWIYWPLALNAAHQLPSVRFVVLCVLLGLLTAAACLVSLLLYSLIHVAGFG